MSFSGKRLKIAQELDELMPFPNFENKHHLEGIPKPGIHMKGEDTLPNSAIIVYQKYPLSYLKKKFGNQAKPYETVMDWLGQFYTTDKVVFIKTAGIGAPNAAVLVEELIARGVTQIITLGTAGGLDDFGLVLCDRSVRDEGVSHHYLPSAQFVHPSSTLTKKLETIFDNKGVEYHRAGNWTIDAIYRETHAEVEYYRNLGVKTVDMEASAVFAVCEYRGIDAAAMFLVSDLVEGNWDKRRPQKDRKQEYEAMVDAALEVLT